MISARPGIDSKAPARCPTNNSTSLCQRYPVFASSRIGFRDNWTMIVAMVAMRVMKPAVDDVVDMIPVGDRLMPAPWAVYMGFVMSHRLASIGIGIRDLQAMLVVVITVFVMHMPVMQVIDVAVMLDLGVPAMLTMLMIVVLMDLAISASHRHLRYHRISTVKVYAQNRCRRLVDIGKIG